MCNDEYLCKNSRFDVDLGPLNQVSLLVSSDKPPLSHPQQSSARGVLRVKGDRRETDHCSDQAVQT